SRPLLFSGRHSLLGLKGLSDAARQRIDDVGVRVNASGQAPHYVVHAINIDIGADGDGESHALIARKDRRQQLSLPPLLDSVLFLDLYAYAAPIRHAVWDVHVLNDPRL